MRVAPPSSFADPLDRDQLRRAMRERRRALTTSERDRRARDFARIAVSAGLFRRGMRVGLYRAHGAEADPRYIEQVARGASCRLHWPVITCYTGARMRFAASTAEPPRWIRNRYGILEPAPSGRNLVHVTQLDLIIAPLVAVDRRGWRLGSGAGYYDRCLHPRLRSPRWRHPLFVGLAYEFQRVERLEPAVWDVPLDALLTEQRLYEF